jgi:hypothetical protein
VAGPSQQDIKNSCSGSGNFKLKTFGISDCNRDVVLEAGFFQPCLCNGERVIGNEMILTLPAVEHAGRKKEERILEAVRVILSPDKFL